MTGLERYFQPKIVLKESDPIIIQLRQAKIEVIDNPAACESYDNASQMLRETLIVYQAAAKDNFELEEAYAQRWMDTLGVIAGIHKSECPNFEKHHGLKP